MLSPFNLHPMFRSVDPSELNAFSRNSLISHLSIDFVEVTENSISATMPVNSTTHQPFGFLHGGASMALAETLGSYASFLVIDPEKEQVFGLEINGNHIRSKKDGIVKATASAIHIGSKTHIWEIKIMDEAEKLISIVRLTNIVVDARK